MKRVAKLWLMTAMTCAFLALSACVAAPAPRDEVYAPPPRSPAQGYHQMYRGHDIRYDAGLGVYALMDLPNYFFFEGNYYRYHDGHWNYSRDMKSRWRNYDERKLPPGLAKKYAHEKDGKGRKKKGHEDK